MKLLWVGNLPSRIGGQNRVAYFTIKALQSLGHEIQCAGRGVQVLDVGESSPCISYNFSEHEPERLHQIIDGFKPDLIFFSHDIWIYYFIPALRAKYPQIPLVGWFTIDAHPIHHSWFGLLRAMHYICVPSQFGKDTIYQRWPEKSVEVIRYGVDRDIYCLPEIPAEA